MSLDHVNAELDAPHARTIGPLAGMLFRAGVLAAVAGLLLLLILGAAGGAYSAERAMFAYLVSFLFFMSITLGGLLFVLIHFLCRTGTVTNYRRLGEIVAATAPAMALAAIPVILGGGLLHRWMTHPDDPIVAGKAPFLLPAAWAVRLVIYMLVFGVMGWWYHRTSLRQDRTADPQLTRRMQALAAPGVIVYAFAITFFAIDLIMALDAHWFSTIFGVYYFAGAFMAFHAVLAIALNWCQNRGRLVRVVNAEHYHDVGKMLFAFVVFWAYIAYSQYMLIWYGNLPEEQVWFIRRGASTDPAHANPFSLLMLALLIGHFAVPFLGLVSRSVKRNRHKLWFWAIWMLVFHFIDIVWLVRPELRQGNVTLAINWLDILALGHVQFYQHARHG
ncbi:MAG: hypothetical protein GVY24_03395, partial [Planctomycetes bacterium]|nr:hypothetical protein [Planctomycetota bacterium]